MNHMVLIMMVMDEEATLAVPHLNFELQSGDLEHQRQTVDPLARLTTLV